MEKLLQKLQKRGEKWPFIRVEKGQNHRQGFLLLELLETRLLLDGSATAVITGIQPDIGSAGGDLPINATDIELTGSSSAANTSIDTTAPQVAAISAQKINWQNPFSRILISFTEPVLPAGAEDVGNYLLVRAGDDSDFSNGCLIVPISSSITYDESTRSVTLIVNNDQNLPDDLYQLVIDGTDSIVDLAGNALDGDYNTIAGGDYNYEFRMGPQPVPIPAKSMQFHDTDGSLVTIKLSGGSGWAMIGAPDFIIQSYSSDTIVLGGKVYLAGIELDQSDMRTSLAVTVRGGNGQTDCGGITAQSLNKLVTKGVNLVGDINFAGSFSSLQLGDIAANVTITIGADRNQGLSIKAADIADNVDFNLKGTLKTFQVDSYSSGTLSADEINQIKIKKDVFGGNVISTQGSIKTISCRGDIQGTIEAAQSIKSVTSQTGGLAATAAVIAYDGDIAAAKFADDIAGVLAAADEIKNVSCRKTVTGVLRAGAEIGRASFNSIAGATISSGGDINSISSSSNISDSLISAAGDITKVVARTDILDSYLLAGYDIGPDSRVNTSDEWFNPEGAVIKLLSTGPKGRFDGSYALAGIQPYTADLSVMIAPEVDLQVRASFGQISTAHLGIVSVGYTSNGVYGLFAATSIKKVTNMEIGESGGPAFLCYTW